MRVRFQRLHIRPDARDQGLGILDLSREMLGHVVLQPEFLGLVIGLHDAQPGDFDIELHPLFDPGIPGGNQLLFDVVVDVEAGLAGRGG